MVLKKFWQHFSFYLAPGWRLGWFTLNDKSNALTPFIRNKCTTMCQRILGPNGPLQGALPEILLKTPSEYYTKLNSDLKSAATEFHNGLLPAKGLKPIMHS